MRVRIVCRNNTTGAVRIYNGNNGITVGRNLDPISGFTPIAYWHNGVFGRLVYLNGSGESYIQYLDANDTPTPYTLVNQTDAVAMVQRSQSKYGVQSRQFTGGWMQDITTPIPIQHALYAQYAHVPWVLTIPSAQRDLFRVERGDLVCFSWDALRDENNLPLVNQIGRVLEITPDPLSDTLNLKVLATESYYQSNGVRDRNRY
jgi:hypothetical protein